MTVDPQVRQQRVSSGSRRKRDLTAAGVDPDQVQKRYIHPETEAWMTQHRLTDESPYAVSAVLMALRKSSQPVNAGTVMAELKARGWAKEQRS